MTTPPGPARRLEAALAEIAAGLGRKRWTPDRFLAREILLALGEMALPDDSGAAAEAEATGLAEGWAARILQALEPAAEAFARAVAEELDLAASEHTLGVNPRFLDHPRYDLDYAVLARERLEARLVAAGLLGLEPEEALLERVAEADRLLEPYLRARRPPEA